MHIVRAYTRTHLTDKEFCATLHGLNLQYNHSMIWQSRVAILKTAGINEPDNQLYHWITRFNINYKRTFHYTADVFNVEGDLLYIMNNPDNSNFSDGKVEAGIIAKDEIRVQRLLVAFADAFKSAAQTMLDGRSVRHKTFSWSFFSKRDKVFWHVEGRKQFVYPQILEEEMNMLESFTDQSSRSWIRETAQHGARVWREYHSGKDDAYKKQIGELLSKAIIYETKEKFELTDLGEKMNTGSHWMTLWLTNLLVDLGFSLQSIIWNARDENDEVDLVAQFKSQTWIFELKDKNFGLDKAHSLPFRLRKFMGDKVFVITTGKVDKDARYVFGDLTSETIAIEGMEKTRAILEQLMTDTELDIIAEVQKELSSRMDIDLGPVFERRYGKRTPKTFRSNPFTD